MQKNNCSKCQYWRKLQNANKPICTNMKSKMFNASTVWNETCPEFVKRGQKAPLWMRLASKGLTRSKSSRRFGVRFWLVLIVAMISVLTPLILFMLYITMFGGR